MQEFDHECQTTFLKQMLNRTRGFVFGLSFICLAFALSGCSGCSNDDENKCEGVTCEVGVCSPSSGRCVNASDCGGDDSKCLDGYTCKESNRCEATIPCSESAPCAAGECKLGACVNKPTCASDNDCVQGSFCGQSGTCESDPCSDGTVTCDRGVCQKGTGMCVNEVVCTQENETTTCLEGFKCYEQKCVDESTYCAGQTCDRGVCDFENGGCADAADCAGDDNNCLAGNFCNANNTCEQNKCDANNTNCPRGECEPTTGMCVDKAMCNNSNDCLDGKLCVGTTCVEEDKACGDGGCPGNQVCFYDDLPRTAQCVENDMDGCSNANDCTGTRICVNGACADAPADCREDTLEENDDAASAKVYTDSATAGVVNAAICGGDADFFTFDTTQDQDQLGKLVVEINYDPADIGLGTLNLELIDKNNNSVQKVTATDGRARIETDVTVVTQGTFTIAVGDEGDVAGPGIRYTLYADVVNTTVITACQNPPELMAGTPVNSSTLSGASSALTASCADANGEVAEDIYKIVVPQDSYVKVSVQPDQMADLSVSLRGECLRNASEIAGACSERGGPGTLEEVGALLPAGTYFAVVQGPSANTGGFYDIEVTIDAAICTSADNTCKDANTATVCNELGTAFVDEVCDSGCNMATGRCNRPAGDVCVDAPTVDENNPIVATIEWDDVRGDYDPGANGCVNNAAGPDRTYQVVVPANYAISASLTDAGNDVSLYVVDTCGDVTNSCVFGVDDSTLSDETLFWANPDAAPRTVFVIADSAQASTQSSTLNIELKQVICTPGQPECTTNASGDPASHVCNADGTAFIDQTDCAFGCDMATGACNKPPNDRCDGAITITPGTPQTGTIETYTHDYATPSSGCTGFVNDGPDALYKINLQAFDTVDVSLNTVFDGAVWMASSCDMMGNIGACVAGADDELSNSTERLQFVAPADGEYYIVAQAFDVSGTGAFTLDVTVTPRQCLPSTTPPTCNGNNLTYCDNGQLVDYACNGTCTGSACDTPTGDICIDARVLAGPSGSLTAQTWSGTDAINVPDGERYGGCFMDDFDEADGVDTIYAFDLVAGDLLTVSLDSAEADALLHILEDCTNANSCVINNPAGGSTTLSYYSQNGGRIYVVADLLSGTTTETYDLSWNITQGSVCAPGDSYCVDANTVAKCDGLGTGTVFQSSCPNGCQDGACVTDYAAVDTCAAVSAAMVDVGSGVTYYADLESFLTDDVNMPSTSCTGATSSGNDGFFKVVVNDGEILHVTAQSFGGESPVVYVFTDCADPTTSCVAGSGSSNGLAETYYNNNTGMAQTMIVGIDSTSSFNDEAIAFTIEKLQPQCMPNTRVCAADNATLQVCNSFGLYDFYTCDGTCTGSACDNPSGDICYDAKVLSPTGGTLTGNLGDGTNTLELGTGQVAGCFLDSFDQSDGKDTFYSISLNPGDALTVDLTTDSSLAYVFLFEDCTNANSCLKNNGRMGSGSLTYYATQAITLYVVVDSTSTTLSNDYTLSWRVQSGAACAPNGFRCVDATTLGYCNSDGTQESTTTCAAGCEYDACNVDVPGSDLCATAADPNTPDVGNGIAVYAEFGENMMTNDVDMPSSSCTGQQTDGPDIFYKVVLQPTEILRARTESYGDESPLVYAITDCANPESTCVGGAQERSFNNQAELFYVNDTNMPQTLIVGADTTFGTADEPFGFFIEKLQPQCQPQTAQCDPNNPGVLLACNNLGLNEVYTCNGGCTGNACDNPTGDVCVDAVELQGPTGTLTGVSWTGTSSFEYVTDREGACILDDTDDADGVDTIYKIALNAGDTLEVNMTSTETDALAYILTDCFNLDSCVENNPAGGNATLRYNARQAETVFVVVDLIFGTSTETYDLSWTVTPNQTCAPDRTYCVDATTLALCNGAGSGNKYTTTCDAGCANGACVTDYTARDLCADVAAGTDIGQGYRGFPSFDDALTNDVSFSLSACGGGGTGTTSAPDTFYKVTLQDGETVKATGVTYGGETIAMYIISDCAAPDTTCKAGERNTGVRAEVAYTNNTGMAETLIVGVDSTVSSSDEPVIVDIEVLTPQCMPGTKVCDTDGQTLKVCDGFSQFQFYSCNGTCTGDTCDNPTGEICFDAAPLAGPSGSVSGDFQGGQDFDPGLGTFGGCFVDTSDNTDGGDTFYRIDLTQGDVLSLDLSSNDTTAAMYLFQDCTGRNSCIANLPFQQSGNITYYAAQNESVIVVIDNSNTSTTPADTWTLNYSITGGKVCAPADTRCVDATTLGICNADGTAETAVNCAQGCNAGGCAPDVTANSVCATAADPNAPDIGTGISIIGIYDTATFTNDIDMPTPNCTNNRTDGPDLFYKVIVPPGQVLFAETTSFGDEAPLIYAITDCADPSNTCVAGGEEIGTTNRAEIYYINTSMVAETIIVGIDSEFGTADEPFGARIEVLPPQCTPGQIICDANNPGVLLSCNQFGIYDRYSCNGSCTGNACDNPSGDVCFDSIPLQLPSGSITAAFDANNDYNLGAGRTGGCFIDDFDEPDDSDRFYKIDLVAGDVLTANLSTAHTGAYLFMLSDCNDPNACLRNNPQRGNTTLRHYAAQNETIYLVVDASFASSENYTLDYNVQSAQVCAAGEFRCLDPNTLGVCNSDASLEAAVTCAQGCANGACNADMPTADTCAATADPNTPDVGAGIAVYARFGENMMTNDIDIPSAASCTGQQTDGLDIFYKVVLAPDEILHAWVDSYGDEPPQVYAITDCADPDNTCVAGSDEIGSSNRAEIYYVNSTGAPQTLIVGADATFSTVDEPFGFFIEKRQNECVAGTRVCDAAGVNLRLCNSVGLYEEFTCNGGCANDACVNPSGDFCFDAIPVNPGGTVMGPQTFNYTEANFQLLSADLSLGTNGCLGSQDADGQEKFYAVELAPGQTISGTMVPVSTDVALYVVTDCTDASTCVTPGNEAGGFGVTETTSYTNNTGATQTVFVVADAHGTGAANGYDLTLTVQ